MKTLTNLIKRIVKRFISVMLFLDNMLLEVGKKIL